MLDKDIMNKFLLLRRLVFAAIEISLKEDGHCKSYEGTFEIGIYFPNYFENQHAIENNYIAKPIYTCNYHCYLICDSRGKDWSNESFNDLYEQVKKDILLWVSDYMPNTIKENEDDFSMSDLREVDDFKNLFKEFDECIKLLSV